MLSVLGWLTGLAGPLTNLAGKLIDLYQVKLNSKNSIERAKIDQQIEEVHDKRALLVAEAGNRFFSVIYGSIVGLLGLCSIIIIAKLLVWDKVVGSFAGYTTDVFTTDKLGSDLWLVVLSILGFFTLSAMRK